MKLIVNSKQLYQKLQAASKVVNSKNTLPILDCFKLGVTGNTLLIAASDTESRISTKIDIENPNGSGTSGTICVNAKQIVDALREIPEQPLTIDINDDTKEVVIHYHNGKYTFVGLSGDEYPEPKMLDEKVKQKLTISAVDLHNAILGTLFATADDELRPVINGVYFDISKDSVVFVASDGHKLVRLISNIQGNEKASFILPKKGAKIILDLISKESDDVIINFDLNSANFRIGDYTISVRFIEGRYPNYDSVIPKENPYSLELNRDVLISILKRVSVFGDKNSNLVALDITDDLLTVTAKDIDYSTASEESTEISYSGKNMKIGFKSTFLIELLRNISSETINISLSDPTKAALITPTQNSSGFKQTSLIMPMMLNN